MRKLKLLPMGALFVAVTLAATLPAFASPPTTGAQLMPYPNPDCPAAMTFPAGASFHIQHGWAVQWPKGTTPEQKLGFASPGTNFTLFVDGKQAPYLMYRQPDKASGTMDKWFLTNFPSGMTGVHTFLGMWFNDSALALTCQIVVTFT